MIDAFVTKNGLDANTHDIQIFQYEVTLLDVVKLTVEMFATLTWKVVPRRCYQQTLLASINAGLNKRSIICWNGASILMIIFKYTLIYTLTQKSIYPFYSAH